MASLPTRLKSRQGRTAAITAPTLAAPIALTHNALGWRTALADATGTTSFQHDALGRITQAQAPDTGTVGYAYNGRGQRTGLTYPDGTQLALTYKNDGALDQVREGSAVLADYAYDANGRLSEVRRNDDTTRSTYTYDPVDRITNLTHTTNGETVAAFAYTYSRLGERKSIEATFPTTAAGTTTTRRTTYSYDGLGRLRTVDSRSHAGSTSTYFYDRVGNITSVRIDDVYTESATYNAANQRTDWNYDAAGNLLGYAPGATTYTYDALNRLTSAAGGAITYAYNGDGVLVAETAGSTTTRYTQDLVAPLAQVLSDGTHTYLYGHNRLATVGPAGTTWELRDALGSVRQVLDASGEPLVLSGQDYSPFGVPASGQEPAPFGFTGELHRQDTGLVYLRARWYDPSAGVFTARDPWEGCPRTPYSQHPYQYGYSNPILNTDPSGECVIALYYWEIKEAPLFHHIDVLVNECGPLPDHEGRCTSDPENSITIFEGQPTQEPSGRLGQALECLDLWNDFGHLNALEHSCEDKSSNHSGYASASELALAMTDVAVAQQRGDIVTIQADDKPCKFYTSRMRRFMDRIRTVHVNYNPLFRNSNGVAYALIESAGLGHPQHHPKLVVGYSSIVYDRIENPWEIPISP